MKKYVFTIFSLFLASIAFAQPKFFPHNSNIERWYLDRNDVNIKDEADKLLSTTEMKEAISKGDAKVEDLKLYFHWIDFDKNSCPDLLFNGKIGTKNHIFLYKNLDDSIYVLVMETSGEIIQANNPDDGMPLYVSVWDQSCCGERVSYYTKWVCSMSAGVTFMQKTEQSLVYNRTVLPDAGKAEPLHRFSTKNYASLLRMTPFIDDENRYDGMHGWRGNYIAKYPYASTGVIYHQIIDKSGVTWYFVRMDNGATQRIHSDRFLNSEEVKNPLHSYYYGWIHEGNVNIIK